MAFDASHVRREIGRNAIERPQDRLHIQSQVQTTGYNALPFSADARNTSMRPLNALNANAKGVSRVSRNRLANDRLHLINWRVTWTWPVARLDITAPLLWSMFHDAPFATAFPGGIDVGGDGRGPGRRRAGETFG
jgi:hypothetical protein